MTELPEDDLREPLVSQANESAPVEAAGAPSFAGEGLAGSGAGMEATSPPDGSRPHDTSYGPTAAEPPMFQSWTQPPVRRPARIPHFGHVVFLIFVLLPAGLAGTVIVMAVALHRHLFGVATTQGAATDVRYLLGGEALLYVFTYAACLLIFPLFWHESLMAGLQWNGATALRRRWRLGGAAFACFLLALVNGELMPGPTNAPIEKIFRTPGAAWLLFAFGVTVAPFFEETLFRGFLLPAFCTAFDWLAEALSVHTENPGPVAGRPRWPPAAQMIATAMMAIPIAATCAYPRSGHYRIRLLVFVLWAFALTLGWVIGRSELKAKPPRFAEVDANGHPVWSLSAMAVGSFLVSVPFALLHAQQTGYSVGPFLLLVGVSLVLCIVRLWTRSLASSVVVHACYNFFLFSLMFIGTSGFRHMDKM